jgi:hypothetical protein
VEDRSLCPHCGGELHRKPYLMARRSSERVLSDVFIGWVIVGVVVMLIIAQRAS